MNLDSYKKVRKDWGNINPVEKVKSSDKGYKRDKKPVKKYLEEIDE